MKQINAFDIDDAALPVGYAIEKAVVVIAATITTSEPIKISDIVKVAELILSRIPK